MIVYWDSCVLLAWAKGEARADVTPEDLAYWVQKFDDGTYKLITSSLLTLEALEARTPEQAWRRIKSYLRPPRAEMYDITPPILEKAYEVRNHFAALPAPAGKENHPTLSVPDAIHLATAVVMGAERFHTFDVGKRGSGLGLLGINDLSFVGSTLKPSLPLAEEPMLPL